MPRFSALLLIVASTSCTAFSTVRPARVSPGLSTTVQASITSPPGDDAAWFWSFDCAEQCNRAIPSTDLVLAYGNRGNNGGAFTIGGGINGLQPYVEGYVELSPRTGLGARIGIPLIRSWNTHQLYVRSDWSLGGDARLLWNPGIVYHSGRAPNGESPGSFLGIVNGFGLESGTGPVSFIPSASVVWGRAERNSYGEQFGPTTRLFVTGGVSVTFRRSQR